MSLVHRTLIAVPVALVALGMFAATSQEEWRSIAEDEVTASVETDEDGGASAEVVVTLDAGDAVHGYELYVHLESETARRSLRAWNALNGEEGEEYAQRVVKGVSVSANVPGDCEEYDPDAQLEEDTDGELGSDWPSTCTVRFPIQFDGKKTAQEDFTVRAEVGSWGHPDRPEGMELSIEYGQVVSD